MRVVLLSDTHNHGHKMGELPTGDVLVHAGDHTVEGGYLECEAALRWLGSHPHKCKMALPGNHDMLAQKDPEAWDYLCTKYGLLNVGTHSCSVLSLDGTPAMLTQCVAASPASERANALSTRWGAFQYLRWIGYPWSDVLLESLEMLVTHGPPEGIGDLVYGQRVGCPDLRNALHRIESPPLLHAFGHIHENPGHWRYGKTLYCNVSTNRGNGPATVLDFDTSTRAWEWISGPTTET